MKHLTRSIPLFLACLFIGPFAFAEPIPKGLLGDWSLTIESGDAGWMSIAEKDGSEWSEREGDPSVKPASGVDWSLGIMEHHGVVLRMK